MKNKRELIKLLVLTALLAMLFDAIVRLVSSFFAQTGSLINIPLFLVILAALALIAAYIARFVEAYMEKEEMAEEDRWRIWALFLVVFYGGQYLMFQILETFFP